jgi:hypothetical protein
MTVSPTIEKLAYPGYYATYEERKRLIAICEQEGFDLDLFIFETWKSSPIDISIFS